MCCRHFLERETGDLLGFISLSCMLYVSYGNNLEWLEEWNQNVDRAAEFGEPRKPKLKDTKPRTPPRIGPYYSLNPNP